MCIAPYVYPLPGRASCSSCSWDLVEKKKLNRLIGKKKLFARRIALELWQFCFRLCMCNGLYIYRRAVSTYNLNPKQLRIYEQCAWENTLEKSWKMQMLVFFCVCAIFLNFHFYPKHMFRRTGIICIFLWSGVAALLLINAIVNRSTCGLFCVR
jgi:hypothetical protein